MNAVEIGLYSALTGYGALANALSDTKAVYNAVAPQGMAMPYCVFVYAGGGLMNINPSELHSLVYMVKAVATSTSVAATLQGYIKAALHNQTLTITGYTNIDTQCEDEIGYVEQTREGATYHHRGYYVRIRIDN